MNKFFRIISRLFLPLFIIWTVTFPRLVYATVIPFPAPVAVEAIAATGEAIAIGGAASAAAPITALLAVGALAYFMLKDQSGAAVRIPAGTTGANAVPAPSVPSSASSETQTLYSSGGFTTIQATACSGGNLQGVSSSSAATVCQAMLCAMGQTSQNGYSSTAFIFDSVSGNICYGHQNPAEFGTSTPVQTTMGSSVQTTCPAGYNLSGSSCVLANPYQVQPGQNADFGRTGNAYAQPQGAPTSAGQLTPKVSQTTTANDTISVQGKDANNRPVVVNVIATNNGTQLDIQTQKTDANGNTYLEHQTAQFDATGQPVQASQTTTAQAFSVDPATGTATLIGNSATVNPAPQAQGQAITLPTDYARSGEAATAASTIAQKLDVTANPPISDNEDLDIQNLVTPPTMPEFDTSGMNGVIPLPSSPDVCNPGQYQLFGRPITIDLCPYHAVWHPLINFGFAFMGAVMTLRVLFARNEEA